MKTTTLLLTALALLSPLSLHAQEAAPAPSAEKQLTPEQQAKHRKAADDLSLDQDDLSADVQEMIDLETSEKVVTLFEEIETLMGEVTDNLEDAKTDGPTMAAETEIIEKIFAAAKEKSK